MTLIRRTNNNMLPDWFENFFQENEMTPRTRLSTLPMVNIYEKDDRFEIDMAVPGMDKKDIKIKLDNDTLSIYSEKEQEVQQDEENCTKQEFSYSSFERSFTLPESADTDKISASSENGVLKVTIKKQDEKVTKPEREIDIK